MGLSASAGRARLVRLTLCVPLLAQSLIPTAAATGRGAGKSAGAATRWAARQDAEAAGLPDLNEVRRRPRHEPKPVRPVPSTRRRCPPSNRNCNAAAPQATPAPSPAPNGHGNPHGIASADAPSLFTLADAALGGAGPRLDVPLLDYYSPGGGYSVSDAPPFSPLAAAPYAAPPAAQSGAASASFAGADSATQGRWRDAYGADGYQVVGDSASYPAYAQVSVAGQSTHTWASSTSDVRGLQKAAAPDRLAACWYSFNTFTLDVNLTDGREHKVSIYALDWDGVYNRAERVDVLDAATGAVLDTRTLSAFTGGRYLSWNLRGHALIRLTHTGQAGSNAVVSGLFFDPADGAAAAFLRADSTTQGSWKGAYGADGYNVAGDATSLPPYAQVSVAGQSLATWAASTSDARALQKASGQSGRLAACWYSFTSFTIDVNLTDGQAHQVALYLVDWDGNNARAETVEVLNAATGAVLDSRSVSSFGGGRYLVWRLSGGVKLRVTLTGSPNAVASGLFFDPSVQTAGNGLTGEYYNGDNFDAHRLTRADAAVNFDWGAGSPAASVGADLFSARWTGMVAPRHTETYTFYTTTDDGVRLWVDGQLVIDKWVNQGQTEWTGQVALQAGRAYSVRMEFYERWGGARAKLSWSSPSQLKEVVPQTCLYGCWKSAEQYTRDFFQGAVGRRPSAAESQDWAARLNQAQGEDQLVGEAQALGAQAFASAEYAARGRGDRDYVADLYWAYTQRAPDASGWDYWTGQVAACGSDLACRARRRADVRAAFDQSAEFQEKVRRLCGTSAGAPDNGGVGYNFSTARLDPSNRTGAEGADAYSRNYNFSIPLVSLPGRAGLDLGLTLSYNSLVWTRDATGVTFDADEGSPSPGFRLGFPVIQPKFVDPRIQQAGQPTRYSYLLVTPSGARVELRQAGTSNVYESADSSYLRLTEEGGWLTLRPADGAQLSFALLNGSYRCHEVRDRHGNYITVAYWGDGRIDRVVDTLGRVVNFSYDSYQNLNEIWQTWKREAENNPDPADERHTWATFGYTSLTLQPQFSDLAVMGEQPGSVIPVVNQVGLADGSYYRFDYTAWGQVWKATRYAADAVAPNGQPDLSHALTSTRLDLPGSDLRAASPQADCPRFTAERRWVEHGVMNQSAEVATTYSAWAPDMASCEVTAPDGTKQVSHYATSAEGWKRGLTSSSEVRSGGQAVRTTTLSWGHDGAGNAAHPTNPRVTETTVSDPQGNGRTTRVEYTTPADFQGESGHSGSLDIRLPKKVEECTAGCSSVLRTTVTDYKVPSLGEYVSRRILGLPRFRQVYEGAAAAANLRAQIGYVYDEPNDTQDTFLAGLPSQAAQHYGNEHGVGDRWRGNVNRTRRYSVDPQTGAVGSYVETRAGFNVTGAVAYTKDAAGQKTSVGYADSFFQNVNRTHADPQHRLLTYAYPTSVTDPEGFTSNASYLYDLGAIRQSQTPLPNATTNQPGPVGRRFYDAAGRPIKTLSVSTGAYTRVVYTARMDTAQTYALVEPGVEDYTLRVLDGAGRVRATARNLPGSAGGYAGQLIDYDPMDRVARRSNPTETSAAGAAWTATGEDAPANGGAGWAYTQAAYDWKGRPLVITNPGSPATTVEYSYDGCGCAGGDVTLTRDEAGRRQKVTRDALGRVVKTQDLDALDKGLPLTDAGSVYRTALTAYDALDRITETQSFAGASEGDPAKIFKATASYDGHGRLKASHSPRQDAGRDTVFTYRPDDSVESVTDARGVKTLYGYNARGLLTSVSYDLSGVIAGQDVRPAANVSFTYDAARNRTRMTDGLGVVDYTYDAVSRLTQEKRTFSDPDNSAVGGVVRRLAYDYALSGALKGVTEVEAGSTVTYRRDAAGRVEDVVGAGTLYAGVSDYAHAVRYRASGAVKSLGYGNGLGLSMDYDARLRPRSFAVGGHTASGPVTLMSGQYSYYDDGRVRFADDGVDDRFDRAYGYDGFGRLKEAYAGAQARDFVGLPAGAATEIPYRQSYAYDAFDRLTSRAAKMWSKDDTYNAAYDAGTGRNPAWAYDAEGNLRQGDGLSHTYDAAGLPRAVAGSGVVSTEARDGDGRAVKREVKKFLPAATTEIVYQVRSSVLGGAAVAELDAAGQRVKGYVRLGSELLATQEQGQVTWSHRNPVTGSAGVSYANAAYEATSEPEPMGANLGVEDPFDNVGAGIGIEKPESGRPFLSGGGGWGSGAEPTCVLDGIETDCAVVNNLMESGGLKAQYWSYEGGGWRHVEASLEPMGVGIFRGGRFVEGGGVDTTPTEADEDSPVRIATHPGHWEDLFSRSDFFPGAAPGGAWAPGTRNSGFSFGPDPAFTEEQRRILSQSYARITRQDCSKFVESVLWKYGLAKSFDSLDKLLSKAKFGKFDSNRSPAELGLSAHGYILVLDAFENLKATAVTAPDREHVFLSDQVFGRPALGYIGRTADTSTYIVHELFHVAGLDTSILETQEFTDEIKKHCGLPGSSRIMLRR